MGVDGLPKASHVTAVLEQVARAHVRGCRWFSTREFGSHGMRGQLTRCGRSREDLESFSGVLRSDGSMNRGVDELRTFLELDWLVPSVAAVMGAFHRGAGFGLGRRAARSG